MFYGSAFILKGYIMKITAVIVAGGKGTRMGADKNKVFLKILGREEIILLRLSREIFIK